MRVFFVSFNCNLYLLNPICDPPNLYQSLFFLMYITSRRSSETSYQKVANFSSHTLIWKRTNTASSKIQRKHDLNPHPNFLISRRRERIIKSLSSKSTNTSPFSSVCNHGFFKRVHSNSLLSCRWISALNQVSATASRVSSSFFNE